MLGEASDVARFGSLHLRPGFITPQTYRHLFTPQSTLDNGTGVGLGWRVSRTANDIQVIHHSGNQEGSRAHLSIYPAKNLSVALLSNLTGRPADIRALADEVANLF